MQRALRNQANFAPNVGGWKQQIAYAYKLSQISAVEALNIFECFKMSALTPIEQHSLPTLASSFEYIFVNLSQIEQS